MEISKERADELSAAWEAATDTQRLSMNRTSWFYAGTTSYYEEEPSKLELKAAARIAELEAALSELYRLAYGVITPYGNEMKAARKALGLPDLEE